MSIPAGDVEQDTVKTDSTPNEQAMRLNQGGIGWLGLKSFGDSKIEKMFSKVHGSSKNIVLIEQL